jgi:hypothetical protein
VHTVETDTHSFTFFLGVGDATRTDNPYAKEKIPFTSAFSAKRSEYLITEGDFENDEAFAGIEALLEYYDEHWAALKIQHQRHSALAAAPKHYNASQAHKPLPDIVLNYSRSTTTE